MFSVQLGNRPTNIGLVVVDMQNGFVNPQGSYGKLGMNISNYLSIIPRVRQLIDFCRNVGIPIFYTEAVREASGVDLLIKVHMLLPKAREERLKIPICVRGTWDAQTIDEIKPTEQDYIIIKRRDGAFQDTELRVWLQSIGINTLIFCGVDTSICVETSLREAFNIGYDVMLISDATASGIEKHYHTTLERVRDYYGVVLDFNRFVTIINNLNRLKSGDVSLSSSEMQKRMSSFLDEFGLLDLNRLETKLKH
jgi:ureidoacrylate peracid hydrolase